MTDKPPESQTLLLLDFLKLHPGLVLSISYVLLTFCGILYSSSFYGEFDIAILKLANVSDLLIIGLSEPAAMLMLGGGILVAVATDCSTQFFWTVQTKWRERPKSLRRKFILAMVYTPKQGISMMLLFVLMFILYSRAFVFLYADWRSEQIKAGHGDKIEVYSEAIEEESQVLTLLGSTTNFLFTYSHELDQISVIPIENVNALRAVEKNPANSED